MITPSDHAKLRALTTNAVLTPEEARFIHQCIPSNSYLERHEIKWWYPVSDTGAGVPDGVRYCHPIARALTPRPANPHSIEQQQPWLDEGISRVTWYQRKASSTQHATILSSLPNWITEAEGLKLHRALASLCHAHNRDIKGLWVEVCRILN